MLINMAILEPLKTKTSAREPVSLKLQRERAIIPSRIKTNPSLVQSMVVTTI
jgi:hypothetical protein